MAQMRQKSFTRIRRCPRWLYGLRDRPGSWVCIFYKNFALFVHRTGSDRRIPVPRALHRDPIEDTLPRLPGLSCFA